MSGLWQLCLLASVAALTLTPVAASPEDLEEQKSFLLYRLGLSSVPASTKRGSPAPPELAIRRLHAAQASAAPHRYHIVLQTTESLDECPDCPAFRMPEEAFRHRLLQASAWLPWTRSAQLDELLESLADSRLPLSPRSVTTGWVELNATLLLRRWLASARPGDERPLPVVCPACDQAFIELELYDPERPVIPRELLSKRSGLPLPESEPAKACDVRHYSHCCLQKQVLSFAELGWGDWIIGPPAFEANYCSGNCRMAAVTPRQHLERERRGLGLGISCCGARELSPLSVTYVNNGTIRFEILHSMVVSSCGCS